MSQFVNILGVESSQGQCSLSLLAGATCSSELNTQARKHSDNVLAMLDDLLRKSDASLSDLDVLAYSSGPGSFTGLRIGAAFMQALAYAHNLKAIAVSSLELLAVAGLKKYPTTDKIVCCIDARVNGVYWAVFDVEKQSLSLKRISEDALSHGPHDALQELFPQTESKQKYLYLGDGIDLLLKAFNLSQNNMHSYDSNVMPHAEDLVYIARDSARPLLDAENITPVYLRGADAWKKISD